MSVKKVDAPWQPHHTQTLVRGLISHLLASRPQFYRLLGLAGEVDGHGGNRISQKVIEVCKRMAVDAGLDKGVVQEEIVRGRKRKGEVWLGGMGEGSGREAKKMKVEEDV